MQGVIYAALGTAFPFAMTVLGAAAVFLFRRSAGERMMRASFGFAAGVMAAAAVFSLLVPAAQRAGAAGGVPWLVVTAGFLCGAGAVAAADVWISRRLSGTEEAAKKRSMMIAAVTLHNIPEGMAVGLAFGLAAPQGGAALAAAAALALGIGVQNIPEGTAISMPLRKGGMSRLRSFALGAASGVVEPVFGVLAMLAAAAASAVLPWLMAFAAGAMMLVVVQDMLPEAAGDRQGILFVMLGYGLMMALDIGLG